MKEKIDELYKKYLQEKMEAVFSDVVNTDCYKNFLRQKREVPSKCSVKNDFYGYMVYNENGEPFFSYGIVSDMSHEFHEGFLRIGGDFLDENGHFLFGSKIRRGVAGIDFDEVGYIDDSSQYDKAGDFHEGYARVKSRLNKKWSYINYAGELVFNKWFDDVDDFYNGFAKVSLNGKWNYIDNRGEYVFDKWYDDVGYFQGGYAKVSLDGKWNYIDYHGNLIFDKWYDEVDDIRFGIVKAKDWNVERKLFINMKPFEVKERKILGGYKCISSSRKFIMKYQPINCYNEQYILCTDYNYYYMYDILNNEYRNLGSVSNIVYYDNFICDRKEGKVYLVYNNAILDITDYYFKNLDKLDSININFNVGRILSREEFSFLNMEEIDKLMQEEKNRKKKEAEEQERLRKEKEKEEQKKRLQEEKDKIIQKQKAEKDKEQQEKIDALRKIQEGLDMLRKKGAKQLPLLKEKIDILIDVDDHREIDSDYIDILMLIDLTVVDFSNVKVSGIDFRNTNVQIGELNLDPQKVYKNDLSNCDFTGIHISPLARFTGVDIRGSKFSFDDDFRTMNMFNYSFSSAKYDENTTFNGKSFSEIFAEKNQKKH